MELLGITITLKELLMVFGIIFSAGGAYWKINGKLDGIIQRNTRADESMEKLEKDLRAVESSMDAKLKNVEESITKRISSNESRITNQEINYGRVDERLSAIHSQIGQVLEMLRDRK